MKCLVTGAAGFIGSHLCERLLQVGHHVIGVDAFVPYYPRPVKEGNLTTLRTRSTFHFFQLDLLSDPIEHLLGEVDAVFHLAAMPGLVRSWTDFDLYQDCNVTATQRLLEAVRQAAHIRRFILASTSSVYGRYASGDESLPTRPVSPYGITKLAAENLCLAYADEHSLPLVVLRYFSVYGPRQRPDMGYHRFIQALETEQPVVVYGDGFQVRGNTYIDDAVEATVRALDALPGETYNVGGGETATVWDIVHKLEAILGKQAIVRREPQRLGDQRYTSADTSKLTRHLGWHPKVALEDGLARQATWQRAKQERLAA